MYKTLALAASAATVFIASGCANMAAPAAPAMLASGALVAPNGMTLYTFDKDAAGSGKSTCNGPCAALSCRGCRRIAGPAYLRGIRLRPGVYQHQPPDSGAPLAQELESHVASH